jgi:hypothetical protein
MARERESKQPKEAWMISPGDRYIQKLYPYLFDEEVTLGSHPFQAYQDYTDREFAELQEFEEWQRENPKATSILDKGAIEEKIRQRKIDPRYASAYTQFEQWRDELKQEFHDQLEQQRKDVREGRVIEAALPFYNKLLADPNEYIVQSSLAGMSIQVRQTVTEKKLIDLNTIRKNSFPSL